MVQPPLQPVPLDALGYRLIGPGPGEAPARAQALADVARNPSYDFDVQTQGQERFLRRSGRRVGGAFESLLELKDSFGLAEWTARARAFPALQPHRRTRYYRQHAGQMKMNAADCLAAVAELTRHPQDTHVGVERFRLGIALAADADLDRVLETAIDIFFQWQPAGLVRVYSLSERMESYHGFLRAAYALEHCDLANLGALQNTGFKSLRSWHPVSAIDAARATITQIDHLFYPYISGFFAGPLGLLVHFVLADPVQYAPGPWPPDWPAIARSHGSFGAEAQDHRAALAGQPQAAARATHHRHMFAQPPGLVDRIDLETWWIQQANRFEYEILDPANSFDAVSGTVDFRDAFESVLTIDRIRRSTLTSNTFPYPSATKGNVFAIADMYETLGNFRQPQRPQNLPALPAQDFANRYFKHLFHPTYVQALTDHCWQTMPLGPRNVLAAARDAAYAALRASVRGSVFMPGAAQANGVFIRGINNVPATVEPDDVFVANVIRALRNTHHGYLSSEDRFENVSRYLAIIDGDVSDDISFLPAVWWMACLGDPAVFCGIPVQPMNHYQI